MGDRAMVKKWQTAGVLAGVLVGVALALSGCGGAAAKDDFGAPPLQAGIPESPSASATEPGTESSAEPVAQPRLGEPFSFASGLTVTISEPRAFTPSAFVAPGVGTPVKLRVVVVNNGDASFNPRHLKVTATSASVPAEQIFDSAHGVVARSEERIAQGATARFAVGFWVSDPADLVVGFTPGLAYDVVTVTR